MNPGDVIELIDLNDEGTIGGTGRIEALEVAVGGLPWTVTESASLKFKVDDFSIDNTDLEVLGTLTIEEDLHTENNGRLLCSATGSRLTYGVESTSRPEMNIAIPADSYYNLGFGGEVPKIISAPLVIDGDLIVNGAPLTTNGNLLSLSGVNQQYVEGDALIQIGDLEIDNTSGLPSGVICLTSIQITGTLILSEGVVRMGNGTAMQITETGTSTNGTPISYISGQFSRIIPDTETQYIFPVGGGGRFAPFELDPATGATEFSVEYYPEPFSDTTTDGTFERVSAFEYWNFTDLGGNGADALKLYYGDHSQVVTPDEVFIARYDAGMSQWTMAGEGSFNGSDALGDYIGTANIASFSPVTFGSLTDENLPVELISFDGYAQKENAYLKWTTTNEYNNYGFDIEHASDGMSFRPIHFEASKGRTVGINTYGYVHKKPGAGVHYYRLKQLDFDGSFEYSGVVAIEFKESGSHQLKIYPNPSSGSKVNYRLELMAPSETIEIQVIDAAGKLWVNKQLEKTETSLSGVLEMPESNGVFHVVFRSDDFVPRQKVVILE